MNNNKKLIIEHDSNGVVRLVLNRPEVKNAFDEELITLLNNALKALKNEDVRVLQLRAAGDHFSAGADLAWMKKAQTLRLKDNYKDALKLAKLLKRLYCFPAPVISVITGAAYGGASGLIAASDLAFASDSSHFCFSEVRLGLIPSVISPYVIRAIGERQARRYFLTAEVFKADLAKTLGLIHDVYSKDQLEPAVQEVTEQLLGCGPKAQRNAKKLIREISNKALDDEVMALTAKRIADIRVTAEAKEGLTAFFEKRRPEWGQS